MPARHWSVVCICLALASSPVFGQSQAQPNPSGQADSSKAETSHAPFPVVIVEPSEDAARQESEQQKADTHDAADLLAQQEAASAAERSAIAAEGQLQPVWWQVYLGSAGALFGLIALIFSIYATISTVRTSRHGLRAYLQTEIVIDAELLPEWVIMGVNIKNVGQTPAYHITVRGRVTVYESAPEQLIIIEDPRREVEFIRQLEVPARTLGDLSLGAGVSMKQGWGKHRLADGQANALIAGNALIYFTGKVIYFDIFERRHTTYFCHKYRFDPDTGLTGDYDFVGNDAD